MIIGTVECLGVELQLCSLKRPRDRSRGPSLKETLPTWASDGISTGRRSISTGGAKGRATSIWLASSGVGVGGRSSKSGGQRAYKTPVNGCEW